MPRLLKAACLLLLAVWLPATLHCQLEAAGLHALAEECCDHGSQGCADSVCPSVEENLIKDTSPVSAPAAPDGCNCHLCGLSAVVRLTCATASLSVSETAPPPELAAGWQFSARAVAPARAP